MSADLASLAEKRLEAPSGFEPLHKGFADQSTIVILLIRLALCFSWVADFAPYLDLIVPKLFPNKPEHKGLKNLRAQASPLERLGCMPAFRRAECGIWICIVFIAFSCAPS